MQLEDIRKGWQRAINFDNLPEVLKKRALSRMTICEECPELKVVFFMKIVEKIVGTTKIKSKEPTKEVEGAICSKCGCSYKAKALLETPNCPLGKWTS